MTQLNRKLAFLARFCLLSLQSPALTSFLARFFWALKGYKTQSFASLSYTWAQSTNIRVIQPFATHILISPFIGASIFMFHLFFSLGIDGIDGRNFGSCSVNALEDDLSFLFNLLLLISWIFKFSGKAWI